MEDNEDDKTTIGLTFLKVKGAGHLVSLPSFFIF